MRVQIIKKNFGESKTYEGNNKFIGFVLIGWADTPAVKTSMPGFHRKMEGNLRTPAQGADTMIWLCIAQDVGKSGLFFQDRKPVATHLPLAWSKSTPQEDSKLMELLLDMSKKFTETSS